MKARAWLPLFLVFGCAPAQQQEVAIETTDCAGNTGALWTRGSPV